MQTTNELNKKYDASVVFIAQGIDEKMEGKTCHEFPTTKDTTLKFLESVRYCLMDMGYEVTIYKEQKSLKLGVWCK